MVMLARKQPHLTSLDILWKGAFNSWVKDRASDGCGSSVVATLCRASTTDCKSGDNENDDLTEGNVSVAETVLVTVVCIVS